MHRTDADGATTGDLYTEGNAALSIPATTVSAFAANSWQEEIANVVEAAGLTLLTSSTDTFDQLKEAIKILVQNGGELVDIIQVISNDSADQDILKSGSVIEFDRSVIKSARYDFNIIRHTDSSSVIEEGTLYIAYNPKSSSWKINWSSQFDNAGVTFSLVAGSDADKVKIQYSSDDLTGTSYFGELTLTRFKETRV